MRKREPEERKSSRRARASKGPESGAPEREPESGARRRGIDPFGGERPGGGSGSSPTEDAFLDAFGRGREESDDPFFERSVDPEDSAERERRGPRERAEHGERAGRDDQATS
ncbi:MAG TPA: hypothetical protein VHQ66_13985 [Myxococcota bacterium]|nr:hypothetical protein [Myxococcota bacterium]